MTSGDHPECVVSVEAGKRWTLLLLVGVPLFAWAFVHWERRLHALKRPPLLDIGLLRKAGRPSSAVTALARHVTESLTNLSPAMMAAE